jgi:NAD(P)-dependent dehydrogenase (short-subunit alcohol dehydrogenase family)
MNDNRITTPFGAQSTAAEVIAPPKTSSPAPATSRCSSHRSISRTRHPSRSSSPVGHISGNIDFDDIHFQRRPYDPWQAYGQSKTANVLFGVEAGTRWAADGITANALNPGRIPVTNLSRYVGDVADAPASFEPNSTAVSWKNLEQGAATSVLLAASP